MKSKSDPERILRKNEEEMSDIELMMADILHDKEQTEQKEKTFSEEKAYVSPVPPKKDRQVRQPERRRQEEYDDPFNLRKSIDTSDKTGEDPIRTDGLRPVKPVRREGNHSTSRVKKAEKDREEKIKKQVKKRKKSGISGIVIAILVVLAGLLAAALLFRAMTQNLDGADTAGGMRTTSTSFEKDATEEEQKLYYVEVPEDVELPSPETEESLAHLVEEEENGLGNESAIVIMSGSQTGEKQYKIYVEDVSWTEARDRCISIGGKLVTIADENELHQVIALAEEAGVEKVWIGCHRENGEMIWEGNEKSDYYVWGKNEPSFYDSGDSVSEDYLLLWYFNHAWVYNDSRNDPVADYPDMYSGKIAYVCEFN